MEGKIHYNGALNIYSTLDIAFCSFLHFIYLFTACKQKIIHAICTECTFVRYFPNIYAYRKVWHVSPRKTEGQVKQTQQVWHRLLKWWPGNPSLHVNPSLCQRKRDFIRFMLWVSVCSCMHRIEGGYYDYWVCRNNWF